MGVISDAIFSAVGDILGGSQTTSNPSGNSIFGPASTCQKVDKSHDEGLFGLGSDNQYQPVGTTFMAWGKPHRTIDDALEYLDDSAVYSGSPICPYCQQPKKTPSEVALCLAQHRREGHNC